jgi:nicotinamide mononucleotide transporter
MSPLSNALFWLQQHYIEVIAVITGLLFVVFTIKENPLLWLFGIVSSGLYIWVFLQSGIYAYSLLYLYYVVIGFYGWYTWTRKPAETSGEESGIRIHKASGVYLSVCIMIVLILAIPVCFALRKFTDSDMALTDALLTTGGMVATWMLTRKIIEQWLFWIIIDLVSFAVMIFKGLYPSALLFLAYTLLAINGYFVWKKELILPKAE